MNFVLNENSKWVPPCEQITCETTHSENLCEVLF